MMRLRSFASRYRVVAQKALIGFLQATLGDRLTTFSLDSQILKNFIEGDAGKAYGITREDKIKLVNQIQSACSHIPTATGWLYHVISAQEILNISPEIEGDVIECGCWKGGSTASLSLACELVDRKLIVCDSFQGLPKDENIVHQYPHLSIYGYYKEGMYASPLEEVRNNVFKYGSLNNCEFVEGFYSDSMCKLKDPVVFAFLDVDLASSMRDCLKYIWPLLVDEGKIYTDDSCDMEVVKVWFDELWWKELGFKAPGYVGSGCGLPLSSTFSSLGYAKKVLNPEKDYKKVSWLVYPEKEGK